MYQRPTDHFAPVWRALGENPRGKQESSVHLKVPSAVETLYQPSRQTVRVDEKRHEHVQQWLNGVASVISNALHGESKYHCYPVSNKFFKNCIQINIDNIRNRIETEDTQRIHTLISTMEAESRLHGL